MLHYYTMARVKETIRRAESLGVTTMIGRTDNFVVRCLMEHKDEGGGIQWVAQTCPEVGDFGTCVARAASHPAVANFVHGGVTDQLLQAGRIEELHGMVAQIRKRGMVVGIAGHNVGVFDWAEDAKLDVDFYMCCYYNPTRRTASGAHAAEGEERFLDEERELMTARIQTLSKPVIHYKILAAGRNDPATAFRYAASKMRPGDMIAVGIFERDKPDMLAEDVRLFEECVGG
jgi:hypothetical protein